MAAAVLLIAILAAQTWSKAHRPDGNDLTSYLLSARALGEGRSPYGLDTPFPYVYPMLLAFLLLPWLALPYGVAVLLWFALSVAALVLVLELTSDGEPRAMAATVAVTFAAIQNTLLNGQVNFFVVLCCVLAIAAARKDRDAPAGAWLGAGIALKLMPALLGLFLLVRGRARAIAVGAAVAFVLSILPAVMLGRDAWGAYAEYAREFLLPTLRESPLARQDPLVFSVPGVVHRWIAAAPPRWVDVSIALAVVGVVAATDIRRWRPAGHDLAAGAAYLLAIVLVSPKSEVHHLAFVIPAAAVCWTWWWSREGGGDAWRSAPLFVGSAALMSARLAGPAQGAVVCGGLVLLGVALAALTPSSASPRGSLRSSATLPSDRAAAPSLRPATAAPAPFAAPRSD
jgi:hypothetical protein